MTRAEILGRFQKRGHNPLLMAAGFDTIDVPEPWLGGKHIRLIVGQAHVVPAQDTNMGIQAGKNIEERRRGMKAFEKRIVGLFVISILLTPITFALAAEQATPYQQRIGASLGYGTKIQDLKVPEGFPKYETRTRFIGNLRGTWYEMGLQYGRRAADLIRWGTDYMLMETLEKYGREHIKEDLARYAKSLHDFSPKMTDFLKGIAEGASKELDKSPYKGQVSDFERIVLINNFDLFLWDHPSPESHTGKTTPIPKKSSMLFGQAEVRSRCSGAALSGQSRVSAKGTLLSPTKNGETIVMQNHDGSNPPVPWFVAYVATPSDHEANVFWSIGGPGVAGGNNTCTNEKGLAIAMHSGGESDDPMGFGVPVQPLVVYAAAYSEDVGEAIELLTLGPPDYRARTGRKTVEHAAGWLFTLGDPEQVAQVEVTAHRHAVRYPGDMNEVGNYLVQSNMFGSQHYFDENNTLIDRSIGGTKEPDLKKKLKHYSIDWYIRYHFKEMDIDKTREMMSMTWCYDMDTGRRLDFDEDGTPMHLTGLTTCAFGADGQAVTSHTTQSILRKNGMSEVWWTQGAPCDWLGPWQHIDFAGYGR